MTTVGEVVETIRGVERFQVVVYRPESGTKVRSDRQAALYPFRRAAAGAWTVARWREVRFAPNYPDFAVAVLNGDGEPVHGKTLLSTVRDTYDWVYDDDAQAVESDEVFAAIDLLLCASMAEHSTVVRPTENDEPDATVQIGETAPSTRSAAVTENETGVPGPVASSTTSAGSCSVGAVVSWTVTSNELVEVLPAPSVA
jgi:hypothetical protein